MYGVDDGDTQPIPRVRAERPRRDPGTPHQRQTPERRETPGRRQGPTRREDRERRERDERRQEGAERGQRREPAATPPRPAPAEKPSEPSDPVVTGHGHGHGHGPARPVSDRVRRLLVLLLAPFALASVVGMVVLFPTGDSPTAVNSALQQAVHGEVTGAQAGPCGATDTGGDQCLVLTVAMSDGAAAGSDVRTALPLEPSTPRFSVGDEVVLSYSGGDPLAGESYQVVDFQRGVPLAVLAALFALAVLVLGRWQGFKALGALVLSFAVLLLFVLPAILAGESPLLVAVFGAGVIMFAVLYLTHGLSARTSTAVLGTMVSLALIGVLSALFAAVSSLTGLDEDTSALVGSLGHGIDTRGLLLAGIVIGALGVLDDVTVTQTSAVWELRAANPALGWRALYAAGLRIGRDHVSSAVNTLVMAYAGAALPVLLYSSISGVGLGTILQSQSIAQEVVRTLVGSIGLVAAVPVTTAVAALVAVREPAAGPDPVNPGKPRTGSRPPA